MISNGNLKAATEPCSKCLLMFATDNNLYPKLRKEIEQGLLIYIYIYNIIFPINTINNVNIPVIYSAVQRMFPIGKPSRIQIEKGFEYLVAVEHALKKGAPLSELQRVSSLYYTVVRMGK